jgi:hypothetical protein
MGGKNLLGYVHWLFHNLDFLSFDFPHAALHLICDKNFVNYIIF